MTNKEYYKEQILDLACEGVGAIAYNKQTNTLCNCHDIGCVHCLFSNNTGTSCNDMFKKWLRSEYIEPCPFENGELVEVSDGGNLWHLRYFSHFRVNVDAERRYVAYLAGAKSGAATSWRYCRKYGSLGGLVKEEKR